MAQRLLSLSARTPHAIKSRYFSSEVFLRAVERLNVASGATPTKASVIGAQPKPTFTPPPILDMPDSTEDLLHSILVANATYADAFSRADPSLLSRLATGQSPKIFWLGCSDSRVSAELSTGVAPGSIFVHRNIAQCFHPEDPSALAALTYAVEHLNVEAIIVCGHTGCGGVRAGMSAAQTIRSDLNTPAPDEGMKTILNWITPITNLAKRQLEEATQSPEVHPDLKNPYSPLSLATLTDAHVSETVRLVSESGVVQRAWKAGKRLSVHGWIYHVATAKLRDLGIGIKGDGPSQLGPSAPISALNSERSTSTNGEL